MNMFTDLHPQFFEFLVIYIMLLISFIPSLQILVSVEQEMKIIVTEN